MGSSRTACRERRQAARQRLERKLRREGRHRVHTRTEIRRAEIERCRDREAAERLQRWVSHGATAAATTIGVGLLTFVPFEPQQSEHHYSAYPFITAEHLLATPLDRVEQLHRDGPDQTPFMPYIAAGTARPTGFTGDPWVTQEALERYGDWGPLVGD